MPRSRWVSSIRMSPSIKPSIAFYYAGAIPVDELSQFDQVVVDPGQISDVEILKLKQYGSNFINEGYISLQGESHPVEFRKVELLDLKGCTDPKATNYKSYYVKSDNSRCIYKK